MFSDQFDQPIEDAQGECRLILPDSLTELRFGRGFDRSLRCLRLPPALRFLAIPGMGRDDDGDDYGEDHDQYHYDESDDDDYDYGDGDGNVGDAYDGDGVDDDGNDDDADALPPGSSASAWPHLADLPLILPSSLRCVEVYDESYFQSSWARHPQWTTLTHRCAVKFIELTRDRLRPFIFIIIIHSIRCAYAWHWPV